MNNQAFLILSTFARSLAHKLRTPLSVISNDLYYFKSLLPTAECDRSIERCRQLSDILSEHTSFGGSELETRRISLTTLMGKAFPLCVVEGDDHNITADEARLLQALDVYRQVLIEYIVPEQSEAVVEKSGSSIDATFHFRRLPAKEPLQGEFSSLTEFSVNVLKTDNLAIPLADALLLAHDVQTKILFANNVQLCLRFPGA